MGLGEWDASCRESPHRLVAPHSAELVHGIVRALVLTPVVGDFRARQLGVFTGSLLILLIGALTIRWIRTSRANAPDDWQRVGHPHGGVRDQSRSNDGERLGSDYNMLEGGLLPIGFVIMATSPLIAARLRGLWNYG